MREAGFPLEYRAKQVGCLVSQGLRQRVPGRVNAVFDSTFYIQAGSQLVCLGSQSMTSGPLNIVTSAPSTTNWCASGVHVGAPASLSPSRIQLTNLFVFPILESPIWSPRRISGCIDPGDVERGFAQFCNFAIPVLPRQGLSRLLDPEYSPEGVDIVLRAALQPVAEARSWLLKALSRKNLGAIDNPVWVERVIGLGPGLTPSGDDYVGGMMIGLHILGETDAQTALWQAVRQLAPDDNVISHAHLAAAAQGIGNEGIHNAVSAIICNECVRMQTAISDIAVIGACSGWDTMTGVATALECWLSARLGVCKSNRYS